MDLTTLFNDLNSTDSVDKSKILQEITQYFRTHDVPQQQLVGCWEKIRSYCTLYSEAYNWISVCLEYHFDDCDLLRLDFYNIIRIDTHSIHIKLKILRQLTKDGRDLRNFEHEVGSLMGDWIHLESSKKDNEPVILELISLMINLVKFSFLYLKESDLDLMILGVKKCYSCQLDVPRHSILGFVDAICRYGSVPTKSLESFIRILCLGIFDDETQAISWRNMNNLIQSHLTNVTFQCLLSIISKSKLDSVKELEGALQIISTYVKESKLDHIYIPMILSTLEKCSKILDINVIYSIINCAIVCISSFPSSLELDVSVDIFCKTMWIWNLPISNEHLLDLNTRFCYDLYSSPVDSVFASSTYFFSIIATQIAALSCQSKVKILKSPFKIVNRTTIALQEYVLRNWNSCFWIDQDEFLYDFKELLIHFYLNPEIHVSIRKSTLKLYFDFFLLNLDKRDLGLHTIVLESIGFEKEIEIMKTFMSWILKQKSILDSSTWNYIVDVIISGICNVEHRGMKILETLWNNVSINKTVKRLPDFPRYSEFSTNTSPEIKKHLVLFAFDLFDTLVSVNKPTIAIKVYLWLTRILGWNQVVDSQIQNIILELLDGFSCDNHNRVTYICDKKRNVAFNIITHDKTTKKSSLKVLPVSQCIFSLISILKYEPNHIVILQSLNSLQKILSNHRFCAHNDLELKILTETIMNGITKESACATLQDLPITFRKQEIYQLYYQILLLLLNYRNVLPKSLDDSFIPTLLFGVGRWPPIAKMCVQGLSLALYALPNGITKYLPSIILKLSQVTSSNLASMNMDFLASLASLRKLHVNLTFEDYRRIFGIALMYLRQKAGQPSHIVSLAYYVTQLWFLSIKLPERKTYIPMIIQTILSNSGGLNDVDESFELVLDMMIQNTCINCSPKSYFYTGDTKEIKTWSIGHSLLSVVSLNSNSYQVIIRRSAGTTVFETKLLNQCGKISAIESKDFLEMDIKVSGLNLTPGSHKSLPMSRSVSTGSIVPAIKSMELNETYNLYSKEEKYKRTRSRSVSKSSLEMDLNYDYDLDEIDPCFLFLQFQPYPVYQTIYQPVIVPSDDAFKRSISILDRTPAIDLYKIGVVFVGLGQKTETEILGNQSGSLLYSTFLRKIGLTFSLFNTTLFTGGLDTSSDLHDGKYAICYIPDERLIQVIFHVATMMPTIEHDVQRIGKKRHIGNDFVTIIWNEGGEIYNVETIPGQFNLIQIVIEPLSGDKYENHLFKVSIIFSGEMKLHPPYNVVINGAMLSYYVRQTAIICNMIAQVHVSGEASSNSKERLRQIKRLKTRLPSKIVESPLDFTHLL